MITTWLLRTVSNSVRFSCTQLLYRFQVNVILEMKSLRCLLSAFLLQSFLHQEVGCGLNGSSVVHSRKRRYVVFPEGSTLTAAACISPKALTAGDIFTTGVAWSLSYDLPNETIHTRGNRDEFPHMIKRHKRDLFVRIEKLMDSAGMDGRDCVLKAVCETAQKLLPRQGILEEILRLIFTYPPEGQSKYLPVSKPYTKAHSAGESNENCDNLYPCPISLLQLGLGFGKYPMSYLE